MMTLKDNEYVTAMAVINPTTHTMTETVRELCIMCLKFADMLGLDVKTELDKK